MVAGRVWGLRISARWAQQAGNGKTRRRGQERSSGERVEAARQQAASQGESRVKQEVGRWRANKACLLEAGPVASCVTFCRRAAARRPPRASPACAAAPPPAP